MARPAATFAHVVKIEEDKLLLTAVLSAPQLEALKNAFETRSKKWRGQYQSMAKAFVALEVPGD